MATPQESITTVNGRRCTRSRARFVTTSKVTSETIAVVTPIEVTTSTVVQKAPQQSTSSVTPPAPPSLSPSQSPISSPPVKQPVPAPTPEPTVSSALGTENAVSRSRPQSIPVAILVPTAPAAELGEATRTIGTSAVPSQVAVIITLSLTSLTSFSDTVETAVPSSSTVLSLVPSEPIAPISSSIETSIALTSSSIETSIVALPEPPGQSNTLSQPSATVTSVAELPQQITNSLASGFPTGGQAGAVAPEQSSGVVTPEQGSSSGNGISSTDIETIVGGTIGGVVGLALLGALLFFCLRKKRRSRERNWDEKRGEDSSFMTLVPATMEGDNTRPADYPYERHVQHPSVSSVYSAQPLGRSSNEAEGLYAAQGIVSVSRTSSKRSERRMSRKYPRAVTSPYTFPNVAENSDQQNSNGDRNPFADPESPANTQLFNATSTRPLAPQPAAMATPRSPFASLLEEIEGAPNWLRDSAWSNHKRTQSSASGIALNSHPPSSVYSTTNYPFANPTDVPPLPDQPLPPTRARPPSNSYSGYPSFNPNNNPASRNSELAFFGEPGPSRPTTRAFTPGPSRPGTNTFTPARTVRQSDPFDLDRPEVLGFRGAMSRMISVRK